MINLQRFTRGHPETVRRLNALVDAVNQLNHMTGDGLVTVKRTPGGLVLGANIPAIQEKIPQLSGIGGGSLVRKAYMKANATGGTTDTCFLDTDATGDEITVNFSIVGGSDLDEALANLVDGSLIFVVNISGTWHCIGTPFIGRENCTCGA